MRTGSDRMLQDEVDNVGNELDSIHLEDLVGVCLVLQGEVDDLHSDVNELFGLAVILGLSSMLVVFRLACFLRTTGPHQDLLDLSQRYDPLLFERLQSQQAAFEKSDDLLGLVSLILIACLLAILFVDTCT